MLKPWQKLLAFWILVAIVGLWIQWWASSGFILEGPICEQPKSHDHCTSHNVFFYSAWRLAEALSHWSELITAVFTIGLAVFTAKLWQSTNNLWEATKTLADDAKTTARAQARDTRILQRAYVAIEPRGIYVRLGRPPSIVGHVTIRNAGNLPARNLSWFMNISWSLRPDLSDDDLALGPTKGAIVVAPRVEAIRGSEKSIEVTELEKAIEGHQKEPEIFIYVWGLVHYDAGFDKLRFTKFCHRYNWINRNRDGLGRCMINPEFARYHTHGNGSE
jgi:hypothetical protein